MTIPNTGAPPATTSLDIGGFLLHEVVLQPEQRVSIPNSEFSRLLFVFGGELLDDHRHDQRRYVERTLALQPARLSGLRIAGPKGAKYLEVQLDPRSLETLGVNGRLFDRIHQFERGEFAVLATRIVREVKNFDDQSPIAIKGLLLELLSRAMRDLRGRRGPRSPLCLSRAEAFISDHFRESIQLSDVAQAAGVHQVYLARVFRRYRNSSVGEWIRRRRVEFVIQRLERNDGALADLALEAGFADQSHLTRVFKTVTGMTPARYRSARTQLGVPAAI